MTLNGRPKGATPFVEPRMPSGEYRLGLTLPEHHAIEGEVLVVEDGKGTIRQYDLKPAFGALEIRSEPPGATVRIAGEVAGTTPYVKERTPSGRYLVSLELDLHDSIANEIVEVRDGERTKKSYPLSANFGSLDVDSTPSGAKVRIDEAEREDLTPHSVVLPGTQGGCDGALF